MLTFEAWLVAFSRSISMDLWPSDSFCRANGVISQWMLSIVGV